LERCRLDLRSPLHTQKSISDILYQWGFNDSASFSRAFREQYGVSPREYRKSGFPEDVDPNDTLRRGRPARRTTPAAAALSAAFPESNETVGIPTCLLPIGDDGTVRQHHLPV